MPHEPGSTRHVDKKMKMAGLGRLRWYCTPREKQCRDQNAFKQHVFRSPCASHGSITDVNKTINDYSNQFYQTYIADKQHIHMNSTRWASLTESVKYLGKEGLCRVEEKDDGLFIAWIDRSPEALLRAANTKSKKNADAAEQRREEKLIQVQIERAQAQRNATPPPETPTDLSIKLGSTPTFQIQPNGKEDTSTKDRVEKPNVFKVAKTTTRRKNTEVEK